MTVAELGEDAAAKDSAQRPAQPPRTAGAARRDQNQAAVARLYAQVQRKLAHKTLQFVAHFGHRPEPVARLFGERAVENGLKPRRRVRIYVINRIRFVADYGVQNLNPVAAFERLAARDHFVKHNAEAENIGAVINALARGLLRRPVPYRPVRHPDLRHRFVEVGAGLFGREHFRQTEIEHFDLSLIADDDVIRFNVAVDDAARVRRGDRVRDLNSDRERAKDLQRLSGNDLLERAAFGVRHDDVE